MYHPGDTVHQMESYLFLLTALTDNALIGFVSRAQTFGEAAKGFQNRQKTEGALVNLVIKYI